MDRIRNHKTLLAALFAVLFTAFLTAIPAVFAEGDDGEGDHGEIHAIEEYHIKLKLDRDGDALDIEFDDLEIGETRQFFTEEGKEILVTRTEEGLEMTVDGKKIDVFHGLPGEGHRAIFVGNDDGEKHVVRIEHEIHGEDGEDANVFVWSGDDGEVTTGEGGFVFIQGESARERLLESGALDELDEETRQRILDELEKAEGGDHPDAKRIKVIVHTEEEHEEDGEEN